MKSSCHSSGCWATGSLREVFTFPQVTTTTTVPAGPASDRRNATQHPTATCTTDPTYLYFPLSVFLSFLPPVFGLNRLRCVALTAAWHWLVIAVGYTMRDIRYKWNEGPNSVGVSNEVSLPQFKVLGHRQRAMEVSLTTGT